jgi:hypothetical protein
VDVIAVKIGSQKPVPKNHSAKTGLGYIIESVSKKKRIQTIHKYSGNISNTTPLMILRGKFVAVRVIANAKPNVIDGSDKSNR